MQLTQQQQQLFNTGAHIKETELAIELLKLAIRALIYSILQYIKRKEAEIGIEAIYQARGSSENSV